VVRGVTHILLRVCCALALAAGAGIVWTSLAGADTAFVQPDPRTWADPAVAGGGYGHSQLSQTQRYAHVTAELTQHAADRMGEALWG